MFIRPTVQTPARVLATVAAALCLTLLTSCSGEETAVDTGSEPDSVSCEYASDGMAPAKEAEPPAAEAAPTDAVAVEMVTSAGTINAELDGEATPCTVRSFVSLAEQGYYDGTECHRLTTQGIFVLQCGDPSATGAGGPGYQYDDELTGEETYPAGTLAMANAGPGTNGSQFFVVYEDTQLPPKYTVFGQIDAESIAVVQAIADQGTRDGGPDGAPKTRVAIETVTAG